VKLINPAAHGWQWTSRPVAHKSDALTSIIPPSHLCRAVSVL